MIRAVVLAALWLPLACVVSCSSDDEARDVGAPDLAVPADLTADVSADLAPPEDLLLDDQAIFDATPGCAPQTILDGTSAVAAQGWAITGTASAITTDGLLVDFKTKGLAAPVGTSAQALVSRNIGIATGAAYSLEWRLKVLSTDGHNQLDAPVAFMASFTSPFGVGNDRSQMIYLDAAAIGWADDTQAYAVDTSVFHVYRLDVSATGHADVRVDGTLALMRDGFTTNGTVAIGDQTNDANVDSQFEVYQARKLCP